MVTKLPYFGDLARGSLFSITHAQHEAVQTSKKNVTGYKEMHVAQDLHH